MIAILLPAIAVASFLLGYQRGRLRGMREEFARVSGTIRYLDGLTRRP